jgi:sporulation protein YqfC
MLPFNGSAIRKKLIEVSGVPKELFMPVITISGNDELRIVNYKGVIEYTGERVRLGTSCGVVRVEGKRLVMGHIAAETALVTGAISKVELIP